MFLTSTFIIILTSCMSCPPPEGHLHHVLYIDLLQGCPVERSVTTLVTWKQYFQSLPKLMMNHSLSFWGLPKQTNKQKWKKLHLAIVAFLSLSCWSLSRRFCRSQILSALSLFWTSDVSPPSSLSLLAPKTRTVPSTLAIALVPPSVCPGEHFSFFLIDGIFFINIKKRKKIWPPFPALDWWRNEWKSQIMENVPGFIFIFFRYSR